MLVIGWGLIPITLFHVVPFSLSAFSWRELLPSASRPNTVTIIGIRWIRESINSLLPVASIGGDVASMRLVHLGGGAERASGIQRGRRHHSRGNHAADICPVGSGIAPDAIDRSYLVAGG